MKLLMHKIWDQIPNFHGAIIEIWEFDPILYDGCDYLSMLGLKSIPLRQVDPYRHWYIDNVSSPEILLWCLQKHFSRPGPWFNIKMSSYQYRKFHCGDKMILWPSYFQNGISYTGKMTCLYWIRALLFIKKIKEAMYFKPWFISFIVTIKHPRNCIMLDKNQPDIYSMSPISVQYNSILAQL